MDQAVLPVDGVQVRVGNPGQERVLAVTISRSGCDWALAHSCLTHFTPAVHDSRDEWSQRLAASPVRVQWDPERDRSGTALRHRTIQVGLSGTALDRYVD